MIFVDEGEKEIHSEHLEEYSTSGTRPDPSFQLKQGKSKSNQHKDQIPILKFQRENEIQHR
jgi:hypothetical protein